MLAVMAIGVAAYFGWLLYQGLSTGKIEGAKSGISLRKSEHPFSFSLTAWLYGLVIAMMIALAFMAAFDLRIE